MSIKFRASKMRRKIWVSLLSKAQKIWQLRRAQNYLLLIQTWADYSKIGKRTIKEVHACVPAFTTSGTGLPFFKQKYDNTFFAPKARGKFPLSLLSEAQKYHSLAAYKIPRCIRRLGAVILVFERGTKNKWIYPLVPPLSLPL